MEDTRTSDTHELRELGGLGSKAQEHIQIDNLFIELPAGLGGGIKVQTLNIDPYS